MTTTVKLNNDGCRRPDPAAIEGEETNVIATQGRQETSAGALGAVLAGAGALLVLAALPCASAVAAEGTVSPLPASDYTVRHVCAAPAPGYAGCLAMRLVPETEAARARVAHTPASAHSVRAGVEVEKAGECAAAYDASCFSPQDLRDAYFPGTGELPDAPASEPQTIALVDAYDDPKAEADLGVYDEEFHLPPCTEADKCFEKVNQNGETGKPPPAFGKKKKEEAEGWALEISTDIEVAHAICQNCHIVLVEADSPEFPDLEAAEETAVTLGATEVSDSWGGEEPTIDGEAFNHPGTVITAAAGDEGYLNWTEAKNGNPYYEGADYPASSPHVVAVGGTELTLSGGVRQSETVWNDGDSEGAGGGGCSLRFAAQEWQRDVADWSTVGCEGRRAVADVSADASPETGVAVYDSVPYPEEQQGKIVTSELGWVPIGGTSVASPIIASMFALAGGSHGVEYPAETLYSRIGSASLYDVTEGGNGKCDDDYVGCAGSLSSSLDCGEGALICNAAAGYDGPTGVGAPNGIAAFEPVSEEVKRKTEEKQRAEAKLREEERKKEEETRNQGGGTGGGSSGGGSGSGPGGGGSTTGGSTTDVSNASPSGTSSNPSGTTTSSTSGSPTIELTAFALTPTALLALNRARPKVSSVHFAFTLSAAARVRATLGKLVRVRGHNHWELIPGALAFTATKGRNRSSLTSHRALTPGRYRLTLIPEHGAARSITFRIG
jgi:hypothetical protein